MALATLERLDTVIAQIPVDGKEMGAGEFGGKDVETARRMLESMIQNANSLATLDLEKQAAVEQDNGLPKAQSAEARQELGNVIAKEVFAIEKTHGGLENPKGAEMAASIANSIAASQEKTVGRAR